MLRWHLFLHAVEEDHGPGVTAVLLGVPFSQKAVHVTLLGVFFLLVCASRTISLVNLTCPSSAAIAQPCLIAVIYFAFIHRVSQRGEHAQIPGAFLRARCVSALPGVSGFA